MSDTGLVPFARMFPTQAAAETRVVSTRGHPSPPDDEYGLLESYCDDPTCNCRRVMLNVVGRRALTGLASISYGFDRDGAWPGPFLDPLNPQSAYADVLLALVEQVLADPAYVARLEAHYFQVKGAAADPSHPVNQPRPRAGQVTRRKAAKAAESKAEAEASLR